MEACGVYLLSSTTSIQVMQETAFSTVNRWRISAFSTSHRTTCLVSPRAKARTVGQRGHSDSEVTRQ